MSEHRRKILSLFSATLCVDDNPKYFHQASCHRAAIMQDGTVQAVPELAKAI